MASEEQLSGVRPLTRIVGERVYRRSTDVEAQIASALMLDRVELCQRAQQRNHTHPEYLRPECLVYLIREFLGRGDEEMVSALCASLIKRSARQIHKHLVALDAESAEESYREVITELFTRILDLKSDRGDFLQVRYRVALKRLAISAFKKRTRFLKQAQRMAPLSALPGEEEPDDSEDGPIQRATRPAWIDDALSTENRVRIAEALGQLRDLVRQAFLLAYVEELPIESKDPAIMTVSRVLHKSGRMIRNYLAEAKRILAKWRGKEN